jgi:hypothetical protein
MGMVNRLKLNRSISWEYSGWDKAPKNRNPSIK